MTFDVTGISKFLITKFEIGKKPIRIIDKASRSFVQWPLVSFLVYGRNQSIPEKFAGSNIDRFGF